MEKRALKQLDPQIKASLARRFGTEHIQSAEIVAREVNNWLQNVHK